MISYAVFAFQYQREAEGFRAALAERLRHSGLELHPEETRLIQFGRHAERDRRGRGQGPPETFDFLGLTHICGQTRLIGEEGDRCKRARWVKAQSDTCKAGAALELNDSQMTEGRRESLIDIESAVAQWLQGDLCRTELATVVVQQRRRDGLEARRQIG